MTKTIITFMLHPDCGAGACDQGNRTALVLEGGGMRGLFTAGVMDVMMERDIRFDSVIGVSAGSSFGCNYKSRQPGRVLRYNLRFRNDPRYMGLWSLLTSGNLVGAKFAYHTMPLKLDIFDKETFETDPTEFISVATDVDTGEPVYYHMYSVTDESLEWLRASASMPVVSRPVEIGGRRLLDGGISDSIPLRYAIERGCDRCVVVLTQPRDYLKKPTSKLLLWLLRKQPRIAAAMAHRHEMYNSQLAYVAEQEREGKAMVIAPVEPLPIGRVETNAARMRAVYDLGRKAALGQIEKICKFVESES